MLTKTTGELFLAFRNCSVSAVLQNADLNWKSITKQLVPLDSNVFDASAWAFDGF